MAQLDDPAAVVADDSVSAAAPEDTPAAEAPEQQTEEQPDALGEMYPDDEGNTAAEPDEAPEGEEADPEVNDELPAIKPPHSWKAEEQEAFLKLPREIQETVSRRETERDRFVQSKAAEAQQVHQRVETEALSTIQQMQDIYAQQLQRYASQFEVPEPDPGLQLDDPEAYVYQLRAFKHQSAQRAQAQQQAQSLQQQAENTRREIAAREAQQTAAVLSEKFPEFLDATTGPKLREELGSIAVALGYPNEALSQVDATDILAFKQVRELKAKADKWDAFQKDKMVGVRAAKGLPKIARPGSATGARAPTDDAAKLLYPND